MRHFIIEVNYKVPVETLGELVAQHRAYLQTGYDRGLLLFSGPKVPRTGGMVVARAETEEEIRAFFDGDPYHVQGVAEHIFVEFNPVMAQPWLADWTAGC